MYNQGLGVSGSIFRSQRNALPTLSAFIHLTQDAQDYRLGRQVESEALSHEAGGTAESVRRCGGYVGMAALLSTIAGLGGASNVHDPPSAGETFGNCHRNVTK